MKTQQYLHTFIHDTFGLPLMDTNKNRTATVAIVITTIMSFQSIIIIINTQDNAQI